MRITGLKINNFKRFSDLSIDGIPSTAKLVLLIGGNGSGKSSVFDAFDYVSKFSKVTKRESDSYYQKLKNKKLAIEIEFQKGVIKFISNIGSQEDGGYSESPLVSGGNFIGRSSLRIVPRISFSKINYDGKTLTHDIDAPKSFIEFDTRFNFDVNKFTQDINRAMRAPIFRGESADTLKIFKEFIEPFNKSLSNIFGEDNNTAIQIAEYEEASINTPPKLIFRKGKSLINYDLLSQGEKQVVITLLNFIVRKEQLANSIYFIDEMDAHLNTAIQYTLLKEITENWIPESCQLWTASHSLGFIDYARQAEHAAIIDFDQLNFDLPQVLIPEPKDNLEVYEIAVSKDILGRIFDGMNIFFVENKDNHHYNSLGITKTIFVPEKNKQAVFFKAKNSEFKGIIDRDFLSDKEIEELEKDYKNLKILRYYSIENYLYHPDNLAEYYNKKNKSFDKEDYLKSLIAAKNEIKDRLIIKLMSTRTSYPFYKEVQQEKNPKKKWYTNSNENTNFTEKIAELLNSDNLEDFYKVFPIKNNATQIPQRQNIPLSELTKTKWFEEQIKQLIC